MRHVFFHLFRHPQKGVGDTPDPNADDITTLGEAQFRAAFRRHILDAGIGPIAIVHSDMVRTRKCALISNGMLLARDVFSTHSVIEQPDLGFTWIQRPGLPLERYGEVQDRLRAEHGDALTFAHWLQADYPNVWAAMGRLIAWMEFTAVSIASGSYVMAHTHVIGISQSPVIESAAPDPTAQLMLRVADMLRYRVSVENGKATIHQPELLRCPMETGWD